MPDGNRSEVGTRPRPRSHAVEKYTPKGERSGLALCLSGGGFRAALFHLGAVRRLNELAILPRIDTISSVSGGSILAAHLAARIRAWPEAGQVLPDWDERVAEPFYTFVRRDLRTPAILRRLLPWNWLRASTGVRTLARLYQSRLAGLELDELPARPQFTLCATDMAFGVNWIFEQDRMGDYQAGYVKPPETWPLARAVAASSCFPPVFNPLPVGLPADGFAGGKAPQGPARDEAMSDLRLTDGGVYDNLGLEPVWKNHAALLVSDGGAPFEFESDRGLFQRLHRYMTIVGEQVGSLRKRWLISNFITGELSGTYWGVGSDVGSYDLEGWPGYSERLVDEVISRVRTDLDAFSEAEICVLENHGYQLAAAAIARHVPNLPARDHPAVAPYPEWLDEEQVRAALKDSHKRKLFGRG